ncbi:MAG: NOP58 family protein [Candidatus Micrarchaeota archaeon]|nr:NOP58 family protein [Candidatus Micrarchaeota archaeon]
MAFNPKAREKFLSQARKKVAAAISSRDHLLMHCVGAVDELNRASNLLFERLVEWYGVYFPEFKAGEPSKFVEGVLAIDRKNMNLAEIERIFGQQSASIAEKAASSVGASLSQEDLSRVRLLAREIKSLWALRDEIEAYESRLAEEICPNLAHLAGPQLAAKLVAQAGGLQRLATFPSSTIQVLGAEKALFKHLRSGSRPPKHGLIFQHAMIGKSPRKLRGRLARALASQLSIAAKADALSHNFIAPKLKEKFELQAKRILSAQRK